MVVQAPPERAYVLTACHAMVTEQCALPVSLSARTTQDMVISLSLFVFLLCQGSFSTQLIHMAYSCLSIVSWKNFNGFGQWAQLTGACERMLGCVFLAVPQTSGSCFLRSLVSPGGPSDSPSFPNYLLVLGWKSFLVARLRGPHISRGVFNPDHIFARSLCTDSSSVQMSYLLSIKAE